MFRLHNNIFSFQHCVFTVAMTNRQNSLFRESYSSNFIEKYFVDFVGSCPRGHGFESSSFRCGKQKAYIGLAAGFIQSSLWKGLAKFFDFDRIR